MEIEATRPATAIDRAPPALAGLLEQLGDDDVCYCLPRDGHALAELAGGGELDVLVSPAHRPRLEARLRERGFVRLPVWGYAPHRFWIRYDEASDAWFKVDLVDRISCGRPVHGFATSLGERCLRHRRRAGGTFVPAPEDELVTLLFHCWLDKGAFSDAKRARLRVLCEAVEDPEAVTRIVAEHGRPDLGWERISRLILAEEWSILMDERSDVARALRARDGTGIVARTLRDRALRKAGRVLRVFRRPALTVALLAPDGAGKSTLSKSVRDGFFFPMRSVYMGLYQKDTGWIGRLTLPGFGFVMRIVRQWVRWASARWHTAQGRFVIFDRYSYDALLAPGRPLGWAARARRWLLARSCPAPDLVFVLDAPGEVLHARKGEHTPEQLEQQRQQYLELGARLPDCAVIDVTQELPRVRREITNLIWRRYAGEPG